MNEVPGPKLFSPSAGRFLPPQGGCQDELTVGSRTPSTGSFLAFSHNRYKNFFQALLKTIL